MKEYFPHSRNESGQHEHSFTNEQEPKMFSTFDLIGIKSCLQISMHIKQIYILFINDPSYRIKKKVNTTRK